MHRSSHAACPDVCKVKMKYIVRGSDAIRIVWIGFSSTEHTGSDELHLLAQECPLPERFLYLVTS